MPSCPPARPVPSIVGCKRRKRTWPPWKKLAPLEARRGAARQEAEAARRRSDEARQSLKTAQRRWREAVLAAGLPQRITSKQVQQLFVRGDRLAEMEHPAAERREELCSGGESWRRYRRGSCSLRLKWGWRTKESGVRGQGSGTDPISILKSLADAAQRQEAAIAAPR